MFSFGAQDRRQFGGVGLMIGEPRVHVAIRPAPSFSCTGLHANRAARICRQVAECWLDGELPNCEVAVTSAPREHSGLGLGTQLSLAIAAGLPRFCGVSRPPGATEMAVRLGRARRSSVGTHGFVQGGLIVDAGHAAGESIGAVVHRAELPAAWRVLLVAPRRADGLSGGQERLAFGELQPVTPETTGGLAAEVLLEMLPAVHSGDFEGFSKSVYRFNRTAGECFAAVQGGPFTRDAAWLVERMHDCGTLGAAQSSWGPTVFAFAENERAARHLRERLGQTPGMEDCEVLISRPDNHGAVVDGVSIPA